MSDERCQTMDHGSSRSMSTSSNSCLCTQRLLESLCDGEDEHVDDDDEHVANRRSGNGGGGGGSDTRGSAHDGATSSSSLASS